MSNKLYEENDIQNIANAIRNKNGTEDTYKVSQMSTAIDSIEVIEQATAEGESLSLTNTKAMPYSDYVVEGKSEQDGEPSPSNPSEIHSVADDVNWFDKEATISSTGYITSYTYSNGIYTIIPTGTGNPQIRLNVSIPQGTYTLNSNNYLSIATILRNNNGLLYSFENNYENQTFTINESSSELVFNWVNPNNTNPIILDFNTLKIQKGTVATPYSPYNQGTVTLKQRGKNLFDYNSYTYDKTIQNVYRFIEIKDLEPNTVYVISNYQNLTNSGFDNVYMARDTKYSSIIFANLVGNNRVPTDTNETGKLYLCAFNSNWTEELWNTFISYFENAQLEERKNTNPIRTIQR